MGVMKMVAQIKPTSSGFDIINRSKGTKYIKVVVKNNLPVMISSYVSKWKLKLYGAGKYQVSKVDSKTIHQQIINNLNSQLKDISVQDIKKLKVLKQSIIVLCNAKLQHNNTNNKKRYCKKTMKKYSKKITNMKFDDKFCEALIQVKLAKKDIVTPILKDILAKYPQLKFTKQYKITKSGAVMYRIIKKIK